MKIQDLIASVENANLLVERDIPPDKVGEIILPEKQRADLRTTAGTVLMVGPKCEADVQPGSRILFGEMAGASVGLLGEGDSRIIFLPDGDVLAVLSGLDEVLLDENTGAERWTGFGPPLEWMARAQARPGKLLLERAEMPIMRGRIALPAGSRTHTRATEAVVRSVGNGVEGYEVGDRVQLAGLGGRRIPFGYRGERELWSVAPSNVYGKYHEAPEAPVELGEKGFNVPTHILEEVGSKDAPLAFDEGDRRALR